MTLCRVALSLALLSVPIDVQCSTFTDTPPKDYFMRAGLDDCLDRFYTNSSFAAITSVYNGQPVQPGEYSAFAAIGWTRRATTKVDYLCGGTLITLRHVLTAAHCAIDGKQTQPDTVRLGDVDLLSDEVDEHAQQIAIKRFIKHPDYRASRSYHDIALVELEADFNPSNFVCSACLWTGMELDFELLTVMGFGTTHTGSELSPVLLKADLPVLEDAEYIIQFPMSRRTPEGIMKSQFCAAAPNKDACPGDSGGPILVELADHYHQKKVPFVTGIVSMGTGCNEGSMGLYTRVASYIDWIQNVTGANFDPKNCARSTECAPFYKDSVSSVQRPPFSPEFHVDLMNGNSSESICGGVLIDYRHVVTSADCVLKYGKPKFVQLRDDRANITEITLHPKFHHQGNNLAILGLDRYYDSERNFKTSAPVCLPKAAITANKAVSVSAIEPRDHYRLTVNALTDAGANCPKGLICTKNLKNLIPETCAFHPGGSVASYVRNEDGIDIPFLHGINSKGSSCGGRQHRFEAVSIVQHYPWIESVVLAHIVEAMKYDETFTQQQYFEGDPCPPASGKGLGRCVHAKRCPRLLMEYREGVTKIKTCTFDGHVPYVCCPNAYL